MKKFLPLFLLLIGIGVVVGVFFIVKGRKGSSEEVALLDVPFAERPVASLAPSDDGHWLTLKIEKIEIDAVSLDYELLYKLPDGRTQGVPGTITLKGESQIERELLLGSESSGKFRYDEGVENGTLTLRFRNKKGKLLVKFSTEFSLLSETSDLVSVDGKFAYTLDKLSEEVFFVVMETFGAYNQGDPEAGPYGVFASEEGPFPGVVKISEGSGHIFRWNNTLWEGLGNQKEEKSTDLGIFVRSSGNVIP